MNTNLPQLFTYDSGQQIRTVIIDGEPWFVATDICAVLGIADTRKAVGYLDDDERTTNPVTDSLGREQNTSIVNEPGLYSLILRSRKPEAKTFKRWITHEVIPTIRKTGSYGTAQIPGSFAEALELAARQARELEEAKPKAAAWNELAASKDDFSVRHAAQILSRDPNINIGQNRLFAYMRQINWIDSRGRAYQTQVDAKRIVAMPKSYSHPHTGEPKLTAQIRITMKGLQTLHQSLGGVAPLRYGQLELPGDAA